MLCKNCGHDLTDNIKYKKLHIGISAKYRGKSIATTKCGCGCTNPQPQ